MNRKRERARRGSGADVSLLTLGVMLFQASAMGLLAFKTSPMHYSNIIWESHFFEIFNFSQSRRVIII